MMVSGAQLFSAHDRVCRAEYHRACPFRRNRDERERENVVSYLAALEARTSTSLKTVKAPRASGWQAGGGFLPWHADGVVLDAHPSMERWAGAYQKNGSLEDWIALMARRTGAGIAFGLSLRPDLPRRCCVSSASAFSSCTNWGGSRGGKTAALKAALSVWVTGTPDGELQRHYRSRSNAWQALLRPPDGH